MLNQNKRRKYGYDPWYYENLDHCLVTFLGTLLKEYMTDS